MSSLIKVKVVFSNGRIFTPMLIRDESIKTQLLNYFKMHVPELYKKYDLKFMCGGDFLDSETCDDFQLKTGDPIDCFVSCTPGSKANKQTTLYKHLLKEGFDPKQFTFLH